MRNETSPTRALTAGAAAFEAGIIWLAFAAVVALAWPERVTSSDWRAFAVLAPLIAAVHLLGEYRQKHQGSHLSLAPVFAAIVLLPPSLAALALALAFLPEWLRVRQPWYIAAFNIANFVGPALVAQVVLESVAPDAGATLWSLGALLAILTFLVLHYGALCGMLLLARGIRVAETVRLDCVVIDAALLSLGAAGAALWYTRPELVLLTLLPIALSYRSLAIPRLVEASRIEPKTGLFNMRHFQVALEQELGRATRFSRPLALLMVDVDHLRQINNEHGHLAGDRALCAVAASLRRATRDYDVPARFGGDEFCVLLPETALDGAIVVAERIRADVEADGGVTVSIGVAAHSGDGIGADDLLALADRAAYRAKFSGRNTVAIAPLGDPVHEAERLLREAAPGA
jgi:diguanylate cyclase (GGDEF)-like protein